MTGPSGTTRLDGVIEFTRGRNGSAFFSDQIQLSFTEAEVSGATLTNYNVTLSGSGDTDSTDALQPDAIVTRRLSSNFSLTADYTGSAESPIEVMTLTEFVGVQPDAFYTTGMLAAEASDGSALELQADNGNPETLQTTINADAGTISFADPWGSESGFSRSLRVRLPEIELVERLEPRHRASMLEPKFRCVQHLQ